MRPLHVLVLLLPLVVAYEIGSILYLRDYTGQTLSVSAYQLFADFFNAFKLAGASLPSVALVAVFLTWHLMVRDRRRIDPATLGGMLMESIAWTLPLLLLSALIAHAHSIGILAQPAGVHTIDDLSPAAKITIAVGAGLYEEMLFRHVGLALLHFVLVDLLGIKPRWGSVLAVCIAALGFTLYHHGQATHDFVFRLVAGIYLGSVYVMRGFGIVVGTHAIFDVLALVALSQRP